MSVHHLPLPTPAHVREAAHEAIRDCADLTGSLSIAAQHPDSVTQSDKDVLRYRLKALTKAVERLL